ncbi:MAG TPA: hypothetical protein VMV82_07605 [Candidatus Dormibacteraeota bacterium]|nr:hypothetical protein [Candidatus Dormibacteraeota bacterium]
MLVNFIKPVAAKLVLASGVLAAALVAMPRPASADTTSTIAIAAAAALIVGAIAYDNSGRPYYERDNRRWYVSREAANYYRYHRFPQRYGSWNRGGGRQYGQGRYGQSRYGQGRYGQSQYGRGRYGQIRRGGSRNSYGSTYRPPHNGIR